jgi:thioredoxin-dependent peroxiredoxin
VKQVKSLRSAFATLSQHQIQVIGISMDTVAEQKAFSDKFSLPFPLLADTTGAICDAYRVEHPKSLPRRETFLFRNGILVHHDRAVNPKTQANDVLRKIEELR